MYITEVCESTYQNYKPICSVNLEEICTHFTFHTVQVPVPSLPVYTYIPNPRKFQLEKVSDFLGLQDVSISILLLAL